MSEQNRENNDFVGNFYSNTQQDQNMNTNNYYNGTTTNNQYYQNPMYDSMNSNSSYSAQYNEVEEKAKVQNVLAKTFAFMFAVLIITAFSAYETAANTSFIYTLFSSKLWIVLVAAEFVTVVAAQSAMKKNNVIMSGIMLIIYSVVNGMTLSSIFLIYDLGSIVSIFILAAVVFGALAIFGLVTKKDLGALGSVGFMLLIGVIALSLMNLFIRSDSLSLGIAAIGLAVFIGLTAYDVQKIKKLAAAQREESTTVLAMYGALMLYLDLVNIFLYLLRLFGKRD